MDFIFWLETASAVAAGYFVARYISYYLEKRVEQQLEDAEIEQRDGFTHEVLLIKHLDTLADLLRETNGWLESAHKKTK